MRNSAIHPKMNRRDLLHLLALYDAEILFTDQHIGRLLEALDSNGLKERTLVVVTSDHGDEFFEHGGKGHRRTLFDEQLKVPLLIRMPERVPAGLRVSSQVRHIDLMPTILSLLGLPLETPVSGTSVTGMLERSNGMLEGSKENPGPTAVSRLVNEHKDWIAVRTNDRKYLVVYGDERRNELLYDLASDPRELKPIASRVVAFSRGEGPIELDGFMSTLTRLQSKESTLREAHGGATPEKVDLPDDVVKRLRSLGYIQ